MGKIMRKIIYILLFVFILSGVLLASDSSFVNKKSTANQKQAVLKPDNDKSETQLLNDEMSAFVDSILVTIPQNRENLSVAIPAFDHLNNDRVQKNINFAFVEMLASRLKAAEKYELIAPKKIARMQRNLDLKNSLYESKKEALFGEVIDADYLIVGKLESNKDKSLELVTVKVVDVKKKSIIAEKTGSFERKPLDKAASGVLIKSDSYEFLPPSLKLILGAEYFKHYTTTHFKDKTGDIGFVLGVNYDQNKRHSYQFLTSFLFGQTDPYQYSEMTFENPKDPTQTLLSKSSINFTKSRSYQLGYGYIFKSFRKVYMRPSLFVGHTYVEYDYVHAGYIVEGPPLIIPGLEYPILEYPVDGKLKKTASTTSDYVNGTVDVLINYNSRVSYFVSCGYKFMFNLFMDSWSAQSINGYGYSGMYDAIISGVTMRAGVSVHL